MWTTFWSEGEGRSEVINQTKVVEGVVSDGGEDDSVSWAGRWKVGR